MSCKRFYQLLFLNYGQVVKGLEDTSPIDEPDLLKALFKAENAGCDGAIIVDMAETDSEREINLNVLKNAKRTVGLPLITGGNVKKFDDVKKLLYAGCEAALINLDDPDIFKALKEASKRFGKEKIVGFTKNVHIITGKVTTISGHEIDDLVGTFLFDPKDSMVSPDVLLEGSWLPTIALINSDKMYDKLLKNDLIAGITGKFVDSLEDKIYEYKLEIRDKLKCDIDIFESAIKWADFKKLDNGLIPVIIQDHKTDEVLMMAFMNEESFNITLKSRKMTYWSRSRQSLWTKGETSGNYQYVKSLAIDCDNDTLLAKVIQIGAACHTGNKSCFYRKLVDDNKESTNPYKVFEDVYSVIADRKIHPKEGSYTNYLFDKGIDKILKKVGEEATEIVIAAKNPDKEEIKYEVADFLYHTMVLMVERGVTWEDITEELANR